MLLDSLGNQINRFKFGLCLVDFDIIDNEVGRIREPKPIAFPNAFVETQTQGRTDAI
jgi:hypothetical protein